MKNKSAGKLDLRAAVATIHTRAPQPWDVDPSEIEEELLLAAGDAPDRESYFDFDESRQPFEKDGQLVKLTLDSKARMLDYRDRKFKRRHRSMITIPPKVRENIQRLCGDADGTDYVITTCLIALADYAARHLLENDGRLHVSPADDPREEERKAMRRKIMEARRGW